MEALSVQEAKKLIEENNELKIIDVRTPHEYNEGHIQNAINIPLNEIQNKEFDKNKEYLLYCRSDGRSKFANQILKSNQINSKYIIGGYLKWTEISH